MKVHLFRVGNLDRTICGRDPNRQRLLALTMSERMTERRDPDLCRRCQKSILQKRNRR
jgi:hypothetical protein